MVFFFVPDLDLLSFLVRLYLGFLTRLGSPLGRVTSTYSSTSFSSAVNMGAFFTSACTKCLAAIDWAKRTVFGK